MNITQLLFTHGLSSDLQLAQAHALLEETQASEQTLKQQREQLEHALAVLLGRTPESLHIAVQSTSAEPPVILSASQQTCSSAAPISPRLTAVLQRLRHASAWQRQRISRNSP